MVMFVFSACIAFIVFSTFMNVVCNFIETVSDFRYQDTELYWFIIAMCSVFWIFAIPISLTLFIMYLLKLLTDKISQGIIGLINSRKVKKEGK